LQERGAVVVETRFRRTETAKKRSPPRPSLFVPQAAATNCSSHWVHHDIFLEGNYEVRLKDADSAFVPNVGNLAPRPAKWSATRFKNQPGT